MAGVNATLDEERLRTALHRFRLFFEELRGLFLERDDVLEQAALALLAREHHLITGPPGTAKSAIASAIVGRIVDERTGTASLFARQITESTVQTDLVGPIDFKALTETGRTEHFTDEGLLGAVHAHLDEVLDGRDMLLRSTLNLLHERELKQGTRIVRGAVECALMTTNRYLAEVLEDSRDRLLAFVDRIAYVGFVPKGFADPAHLTRVLEVQAGGRRPPSPSALLTIQDLDVLQDAVDAVHVPAVLFERLAQLLACFEEECASAARADPSFLPTRYLSTRTAVRLARALKASCVLDAAFAHPERALEARSQDFARLRLSLLLSGPSPSDVEALLARETDPRERRQLEILRTERELFEHALARLPEVREDAAPRARTPREPAAATTQSSEPPADEGRAWLGEALPEGFLSSAERDEDPIAAAVRIAQRADVIERRSGRDEARWLRGRALVLARRGLESADVARGAQLEASLDQPRTLAWAVSTVGARLGRLESAIALRTRARARGADELDPGALDDAIRAASARACDDVAATWDACFFELVSEVVTQAPDDSLRGVLSPLRPAFERMAESERTLATLGIAKPDLRARVVGPRLAPLLRRVWQRFEPSGPRAVVDEAAYLRDQLHEVGLRAVVSAESQLEWALEALVRTVPAIVEEPTTFDRASYRALREAESPMPIAYALVQVFVQLLGEVDPLTPEQAIPRLRDALAALPPALTDRALAVDLGRIERALGFFERFWETLEREAFARVEQADPPVEAAIDDALRTVVKSGFFHLTTDEAALARFELEAELVTMLFPSAQASTDALRERAAGLATRSRERLAALFAKRAEARWARLLG